MGFAVSERQHLRRRQQSLPTVIRVSRLLSGKQNLPPAIVVDDEEERIRRFLPAVKDLVTEGLAIVEEVEVVRVGQARADAVRTGGATGAE